LRKTKNTQINLNKSQIYNKPQFTFIYVTIIETHGSHKRAQNPLVVYIENRKIK
jgi:hypothetical protein